MEVDENASPPLDDVEIQTVLPSWTSNRRAAKVAHGFSIEMPPTVEVLHEVFAFHVRQLVEYDGGMYELETPSEVGVTTNVASTPLDLSMSASSAGV